MYDDDDVDVNELNNFAVLFLCFQSCHVLFVIYVICVTFYSSLKALTAHVRCTFVNIGKASLDMYAYIDVDRIAHM